MFKSIFHIDEDELLDMIEADHVRNDSYDETKEEIGFEINKLKDKNIDE